MTTSPDHDATAWQYVREEITGLRQAVSQDMDRLRTSLDGLVRDLSKFTSDQLARVAVLERRAEDTSREIGEVRAAAGRIDDLDRAVSAHATDLNSLKIAHTEALRHRNTIIAGLIVGVLVAIAAAVLAVLAATN